MGETDLVASAIRYAADIYTNSYRPDSKQTPFVAHLSETADLIRKAGGAPAEIAAAWLHDVVEDGHATVAVLEQRFGSEVATLVEAVTDPEPVRDRPIAERKDDQAKRLAQASPQAQRLKLAEQISILWALAVERPRSWTIERSIAYINGTQRVADNCRGASALLDAEFIAAHAAAASAAG